MIFWPWLALFGSVPACHLVDGDRITMRDLAAADARFASADPAESVGFAPAPGSKRVFYPGELMRLANREKLAVAEPLEHLCFERPTRPVTPENVVAAIRKWAPPGAAIEVVEQCKFPAPLGDAVFPRPANGQPAQDGSVLLRGYVEFSKAQRFPLWARVRLSARMQTVLAVTDIPAGTEISAAQIQVRETEMALNSPPLAASADQVIHRIARRKIAAGTAIPLSALDAPKQVREGSVIKVEVRNGGAHLELECRAEADGRTGDMISVRNPSSGKAFRARVIAENTVLVIPPGTTGTESK